NAQLLRCADGSARSACPRLDFTLETSPSPVDNLDATKRTSSNIISGVGSLVDQNVFSVEQLPCTGRTLTEETVRTVIRQKSRRAQMGLGQARVTGPAIRDSAISHIAKAKPQSLVAASARYMDLVERDLVGNERIGFWKAARPAIVLQVGGYSVVAGDSVPLVLHNSVRSDDPDFIHLDPPKLSTSRSHLLCDRFRCHECFSSLPSSSSSVHRNPPT